MTPRQFYAVVTPILVTFATGIVAWLAAGFVETVIRAPSLALNIADVGRPDGSGRKLTVNLENLSAAIAVRDLLLHFDIEPGATVFTRYDGAQRGRFKADFKLADLANTCDRSKFCYITVATLHPGQRVRLQVSTSGPQSVLFTIAGSTPPVRVYESGFWIAFVKNFAFISVLVVVLLLAFIFWNLWRLRKEEKNVCDWS